MDSEGLNIWLWDLGTSEILRPQAWQKGCWPSRAHMGFGNGNYLQQPWQVEHEEFLFHFRQTHEPRDSSESPGKRSSCPPNDLCFNLQTTQCSGTPIRFLFYLNYLNKVMFLTYLVWGTKILIHQNSIRGRGRREERFMPNVIDHWKRSKVFTWEKERMPKYAWRAGGLRG